MNWTGRWIWSPGDENPWNYYLCARKSFDLDEIPEEAFLHITADSRYVVWVNGERLGQGPVRSWPHQWSYDTYDLRGRLCKGSNLVAVLVMHAGVGNFQTLPTRGGLLAEVHTDGQIIAATDSSWKLHEHPAYSRDTPRVTCQQAWVEHYNAFWEQTVWQNIELGEHCSQKWQKGETIIPNAVDWRMSDFDDSKWVEPVDVGPVGCEPWTSLVPRDIPFLTEEPLYPVNVLRARIVEEPQVWHFRLRETLLPGKTDANPAVICGLLATVVEVDSETPVKLYSPCEGNYSSGHLRVNGVEVERTRRNGPPYDHGVEFEFTLQPGRNLLVWNISGQFHDWNASYVIHSPSGLDAQPAILPPFKFVSYGPFESQDQADFQGVWNAKTIEDLKPFESYAQQAFFVPDQVHLATAWGDEVRKLETRPFANLAAASEDFAVIEPQDDGDVEILLDFGKMTVGFWEFEVDGHEGVILDLLGFESIQDGELDLAWGINNAMRYTLRSGVQTYHSVVRRGCRYMLLVARDLKAPIRIRSIRTLQNTYPCVERGSFLCDDSLLNQIWMMGQYTTRLCSEDTYVDCPTYEQTFWVGDARNEGAVNHYAFGEYALSRRCLLLAAESMTRSPIVESQVPSSWQDILPTWSLLWVLACEEYWQVSGDREFLEAVYPSIVKQNDYCLNNIDKHGLLILKGWNLLDWAPLDTPGDAPNLHIQGWFAMALESTARIADVLGKQQDAITARETKEKIIEAANKHLWNETRQAYVDSMTNEGKQSESVSQQTNTIALLSGIATGHRERLIKPLLVEAPPGVVAVGSPFFMYFMFEALAKLGEYESILDMSRRYWGFMLDREATTCWETFPGFEPGGRYTRSHCHAWSAAPTYFLSRYQLGVSPLDAGFTRVIIEPVPAGLKWAKGRVPTPQGEISVSWEHKDDSFVLETLIPQGVDAVIKLPVSDRKYSNTYVTGAVQDGSEDGCPVYRADGGASVRIEATR